MRIGSTVDVIYVLFDWLLFHKPLAVDGRKKKNPYTLRIYTAIVETCYYDNISPPGVNAETVNLPRRRIRTSCP